MSRSDHQEPNNTGQGGQDFEPFMLDVSGPGGSGASTSGSGQFVGAEMEFEPFMFNPGDVDSAGQAAPASAPASAPEPSPVPVTGHAVPPPSYLTDSAPSSQPQAGAAPGAGNGSSHPQSSPDLSGVMMGRSRGHTGPLAAERLGATPASWSDSSLASIADFSAVLIAVQAGRKLLQSGPLRAALPSPVAAQAAPAVPATLEQPQAEGLGQVPQWAVQAEAGAQAVAPVVSEEPPPFIAGADPSSPWATEQPEWASGASHASAPQGAAVEEEDTGLPPWLTEEAEPSAQSAAPEMSALEPEPAVQQAEERPELVSSTFTGTTGVGIQAPESALGEPALETDQEVVDALQAMDDTQSGGLNAEAIEFEGFMFDQGTPAPIPNLRGESDMPSGPMPAFNPAQAGPAPMVVDQDAHVEGEPLPFWLSDAAEVQVTPGEGYVEAAEAAARASEPLVMESVTPADALEDDFADLPPVQPFDFTEVEGKVEDEPLGFNTEELIGMSQGERDSMVVTANLEALADLIGGPLPAGVEQRPARAQVEDAEAQADATLSEPELVIPEEEPESVEVKPFEADGEDMSWMSTVTTDLAASGLAEPTTALPGAPAGAAGSADLSGVLGVSPFDINELDEEEEASTSMLERTPTVGPDTDKLEARQVSSAPETSPRMDEEYVGDEAETATSIFAQPMSELEAAPGEGEPPTSRLAAGEAHEAEAAAPAPEQPEAGLFRARVAGGRWSTGITPAAPPAVSAQAPDAEAMHSPWDGGARGMSAGVSTPAETQAPIEATAQEPEQEHEPAFQMPRPGDTTVSGPLPALTGYEDLVELMEKNPEDIGSYMAMATAYVNSGEFESALRVYRRMIKRPGVSATLLNMVDEELEELGATAGDLPRYHQVRGDLFLKLGRHREAIDEYNKLV
ncbi:MAG TPA: hypothetical protein VFR15_00600 [Chloroflexia bacterium]|nr:hypothetical protein [Chloroflexia bacterium]